MTEALILLQVKFTQKGNIHLQGNSSLNQDTQLLKDIQERPQFTHLANTLHHSLQPIDLILRFKLEKHKKSIYILQFILSLRMNKL